MFLEPIMIGTNKFPKGPIIAADAMKIIKVLCSPTSGGYDLGVATVGERREQLGRG